MKFTMIRKLVAPALFLSLAACAGGGGSSSSPSARTTVVPVATPSAPSALASLPTTVVHLVFNLPVKSTAAKGRSLQYIPAGAAFISGTLSVGTVFFSTSAFAPCLGGGPTVSCTLAITAPIGVASTLSIVLSNPAQNPLAYASYGFPANGAGSIVAGQDNPINVTFTAVLSSVQLALSNTGFVLGTTAAPTLAIQLLDASSNPIVTTTGLVDTNFVPVSSLALVLTQQGGSAFTFNSAPCVGRTTCAVAIASNLALTPTSPITLAYDGTANGATTAGAIATADVNIPLLNNNPGYIVTGAQRSASFDTTNAGPLTVSSNSVQLLSLTDVQTVTVTDPNYIGTLAITPNVLCNKSLFIQPVSTFFTGGPPFTGTFTIAASGNPPPTFGNGPAAVCIYTVSDGVTNMTVTATLTQTTVTGR